MSVDQIIAFFETQDSYKNLRPYTEKVRQNDVEVLYLLLEAVQTVIDNQDYETMQRLNALRLVKDIVATQSEIARQSIEEDELLQIIQKYASSQLPGKMVLNQQNPNPSQNDFRVSNTFYQLCLECLRVWSNFYPNNIDRPGESKFLQAYKQCLQKGVKFQNEILFFKESDAPPGFDKKLLPLKQVPPPKNSNDKKTSVQQPSAENKAPPAVIKNTSTPPPLVQQKPETTPGNVNASHQQKQARSSNDVDRMIAQRLKESKALQRDGSMLFLNNLQKVKDLQKKITADQKAYEEMLESDDLVNLDEQLVDQLFSLQDKYATVTDKFNLYNQQKISYQDLKQEYLKQFPAEDSSVAVASELENVNIVEEAQAQPQQQIVLQKPVLNVSKPPPPVQQQQQQQQEPSAINESKAVTSVHSVAAKAATDQQQLKSGAEQNVEIKQPNVSVISQTQNISKNEVISQNGGSNVAKSSVQKAGTVLNNTQQQQQQQELQNKSKNDPLVLPPITHKENQPVVSSSSKTQAQAQAESQKIAPLSTLAGQVKTTSINTAAVVQQQQQGAGANENTALTAPQEKDSNAMQNKNNKYFGGGKTVFDEEFYDPQEHQRQIAAEERKRAETTTVKPKQTSTKQAQDLQDTRAELITPEQKQPLKTVQNQTAVAQQNQNNNLQQLVSPGRELPTKVRLAQSNVPVATGAPTKGMQLSTFTRLAPQQRQDLMAASAMGGALANVLQDEGSKAQMRAVGAPTLRRGDSGHATNAQNSEMNSSKASIRQLESSTNAREVVVLERNAQVEQLQRTLRQLQRHNEQLQETVAHYEGLGLQGAQAQQLQGSTAAALSKEEAARARAEAKLQEVQLAFQQERESLNLKLHMQEEALRRADMAVSERDSQLNLLQKQLAEALQGRSTENDQQSKQDLANELAQRDLQLQNLKKEIEYYNQSAKLTDNKLQQMSAELQQARQQVHEQNKIQDEVYQAKRELLLQREENEDLKRQLRALEQQLEEAQAQAPVYIKQNVQQETMQEGQPPPNIEVNQAYYQAAAPARTATTGRDTANTRKSHKIFDLQATINQHESKVLSINTQLDSMRLSNLRALSPNAASTVFQHPLYAAPQTMSNANNATLMQNDVAGYGSLQNQVNFAILTGAPKELKGFEVLFNPQFFDYLQRIPDIQNFKLSCLRSQSLYYEDACLEVKQISKLKVFHSREFLTLSLVYRNKSRTQSLQQFSARFEGQSHINLWAKPDTMPETIAPGDSLSQDLVISFDQVPYQLVNAHIGYEVAGQEDFAQAVQVPLPNVISKYLGVQQIALADFKRQWSLLSHTIFRTEEIRLDRELVRNHQTLHSYFPEFMEVRKRDGTFGHDCHYRIGALVNLENTDSNFLVRLTFTQKNTLIVQILNRDNRLDQLQENCIEFILQTYFYLFSATTSAVY